MEKLTVEQAIQPSLLKISIATLIAVDVGYVVASFCRIPVSLVILTGAIFLIIVYWAAFNKGYFPSAENRSVKNIIKQINWDMVIFMLSIFIVVQGLNNVGIVDSLAQALMWGTSLPSVFSILVPSLIVTVGASFMNNWPMTILGLMSIKQTGIVAGQAFTGLVFSNIIGNNLGPHFFPLGSLAILMWLETMKRKGVNISLKNYLKVGAVVSIVEVAVASLVLWLEIWLLGFSL